MDALCSWCVDSYKKSAGLARVLKAYQWNEKTLKGMHLAESLRLVWWLPRQPGITLILHKYHFRRSKTKTKGPNSDLYHHPTISSNFIQTNKRFQQSVYTVGPLTIHKKGKKNKNKMQFLVWFGHFNNSERITQVASNCKSLRFFKASRSNEDHTRTVKRGGSDVVQVTF